jgi:hypothetical protein
MKYLGSVMLTLAACGSGPDSMRPDGGNPPDAPTGEGSGCIVPPPDRQWGGARDDNAAVTISPRGALYVHGSTDGEANLDVDPGSSAHGFIERRSGDTVMWSYAPADLAAVDLVHVEGDESLSIVGRTGVGGQLDLLIGALSAAGEPSGLTRVGAAPSERPFAYLVDGDARTIVGHHDIYVPTNYVESWQDPFVFRWSATAGAGLGALITANTAEADVATGAALTADGSLLIAGASLSGKGSWIRPVGTVIEAPSWKVVGDLETVRSIRRLPDGDYLIAGTTNHVLGSMAFGQEDAFVARLAPDLGSTRWITQLGSTEADIVIDLASDDAGRTWILGETYGDVAGPAAGEADLFVIALDASGAERWRVQRGSEGDERLARIAVDACEHVVVAGATNGSLVTGAVPHGYDAFVLTIDPS